MPNIGDICKANELGLKGHSVMRYVVCPACHTPRWKRKSDAAVLCGKCAHQRPPSGEAKRASELGYLVGGNKDYWLYYDTCSACGTSLWRRRSAVGKLCAKCAQAAKVCKYGAENPRWVSGKRLNKAGYIVVVIPPSDPMFVLANPRTHEVLEHRLVVARAIGRPLRPWEIVHHKNRNRSDNSAGNLELISAQHIHQAVGLEDQVLLRIKQLETQVVNLSMQVSLCQAVLGLGSNGNPELAGAQVERRASVETLHQPPSDGSEG